MAAAGGPYNPRMNDADGERLGFGPESRVCGTFRPGGSKSLAQRALLAAALARGATELDNLPDAADARAALALLDAAGVPTERSSATRILVQGVPPTATSGLVPRDRKSTRLNSSHLGISYAVFC